MRFLTVVYYKGGRVSAAYRIEYIVESEVQVKTTSSPPSYNRVPTQDL